LFAWAADYPWLAWVMNPMTSLGVMLCGVTLWLVNNSTAGSKAFWLGRVFCGVLVLFGLWKLSQLWFGFLPN
jgi:hypothetical protein